MNILDKKLPPDDSFFEKLEGFAYLAPQGLEQKLIDELGEISLSLGRLFFSKKRPETVFWAQNVWLSPIKIPIRSITHGANSLRKIQRNWSLYPHNYLRRSLLIEENLPKISQKPFSFPMQLPSIPMGSWTLLDEETILASPTCSSPFSNGEVFFQETKIPPSRAYLKLWEGFSLSQKMPQKGEKCLEIGSSPGSWSWVLAELQAEVFCIDRAPLVEPIAKLPNIHFQKKDAFSLHPSKDGPFDWIFSDVVCYPEKLFEWIQPWLPVCPHFFCTLKFQKNDHDFMIEKFAKILGGKIFHLFHNKHELTWIK